MQEFPFFSHLHNWRDKSLGYQRGIPVQVFWNDSLEWTQDQEKLGAIRILVCGDAGVGKSSLINKVFGVDVTSSSDLTRGVHDVRDEITWAGRPDLIIHDSNGFEAAGVGELDAVEEFLEDKSMEADVDKRLHAIWQVLSSGMHCGAFMANASTGSASRPMILAPSNAQRRNCFASSPSLRRTFP